MEQKHCLCLHEGHKSIQSLCYPRCFNSSSAFTLPRGLTSDQTTENTRICFPYSSDSSSLQLKITNWFQPHTSTEFRVFFTYCLKLQQLIITCSYKFKTQTNSESKIQYWEGTNKISLVHLSEVFDLISADLCHKMYVKFNKGTFSAATPQHLGCHLTTQTSHVI